MARHRGMVAPINSNKHYVHQTKATVSSGAILGIKIVDAVVAPAVSNAFDVRQGAIVKAVHLEYWIDIQADAGDTGQQVAILEKVPSGQASVTAAQILNLGAYPNKKNILWTFQGIQTSAISGVQCTPIIRDWMLIPKGKQRMGLGDEIVFSFSSVGEIGHICGLATYKEYT